MMKNAKKAFPKVRHSEALCQLMLCCNVDMKINTKLCEMTESHTLKET